VRADAGLTALYIEQLIRLGAFDHAETVARDQLRNSWDSRLIYIYGDLVTKDPAAQQSIAELWVESHPEDPVLLLTLGKISLRNELWGKAQNYFEASIAQHATPEAYRLLGMLLEQLDEPERAAECYRKGIELLGQPGPMTLSEPARKEETGEKLISVNRTA
jgi:HemY protein